MPDPVSPPGPIVIISIPIVPAAPLADVMGAGGGGGVAEVGANIMEIMRDAIASSLSVVSVPAPGPMLGGIGITTMTGLSVDSPLPLSPVKEYFRI